MGVFIKDMEKPNNCGECFFETLDAEYKNGEWATFGHCLAKQIETDGCPLEEVDDIRYKAFKEFEKLLLKKIEDNILHGERRE